MAEQKECGTCSWADRAKWEKKVNDLEKDVNRIAVSIDKFERYFQGMMARVQGWVRGVGISLAVISGLLTIVLGLFGWILLEKNNDIKQMQSVLYQAVTSIAVTQLEIKQLQDARK